MAPKFSGPQTPTPKAPPGPVLSDPERTMATHEGGDAYALDAKSALFTLAATNMVGEDTFYERGADRDLRFRALAREVTLSDPEWVARFVPYLRGELNMRSAAVVLACEYALASIEAHTRPVADVSLVAFPRIRSVIASACFRADEPAEVLGYWWERNGRTLPKGVKRGIADAATRLYSERSALRYDGKSRGIRMADVIDLTHPVPKAAWQSELFRWLLDRRHNRDTPASPVLNVIGAWEALQLVPPEDRREVSRGPTFSANLEAAGMSWEAFSGWLGGAMDADAWGQVAPTMGLMAITRNLRNFDEAGMSDTLAELIGYRFNEPDEVRRSRQFPFRYWTAYREAPSKRWAWPLERAVRHSCSNVPKLGGRTLVLVDVSASMKAPLSQRSSVARWEAGAVFAGAMSKACDAVDVVAFGADSDRLALTSASDIITSAEWIADRVHSGRLGHSTFLWTAIAKHYSGHDRVAVFTDDQAHDSYTRAFDVIPRIYTFDLAGHGRSTTDLARGPGRYRVAGFSDAAFRMIEAHERAARSSWPF